MTVFDTLPLPNGSSLPNRIAKAAMEENMADADHAPSDGLIRLYSAWADGGAGLLLTGNVMVDGRAMTGPGGVVLENNEHLDVFKQWAAVGKQQGLLFSCSLTILAGKCRPVWANLPGHHPPCQWRWVKCRNSLTHLSP